MAEIIPPPVTPGTVGSFVNQYIRIKVLPDTNSSTLRAGTVFLGASHSDSVATTLRLGTTPGGSEVYEATNPINGFYDFFSPFTLAQDTTYYFSNYTSATLAYILVISNV